MSSEFDGVQWDEELEQESALETFEPKVSEPVATKQPESFAAWSDNFQEEPQGISTQDRLDSMYSASSDKPEDVAKWKGLAKQADVSYEVAKTIPNEVEAKLKKPDWQTMVTGAPKTSQYLADNPRDFEIAKDDVEPLQELEIFRAELKKRGLPDLTQPQYQESPTAALNRKLFSNSDVTNGTIENTANPDGALRFGDSPGEFIDNAGRVASTVTGALGTQFGASLDKISAAYDELTNRMDIVGFDDEAMRAAKSAENMRRIRAANAASEAATPTFDTNTARWLFGGVSSLVQTAPTLAVGAFNPLLGITMAGIQSGLGQSADVLERGGSTQDALIAGGAVGLIEGLTEKLPLGFVAENLGKMGVVDFAKKLLSRDMIGEQVATHTQDFVDAVYDPDKTMDQYLAERPEAAIQTVFGVGVNAAAMSGVQAVANRITKFDASKNETERDLADLNKQIDILQKTKAAQLDRDVTTNILNNMDDGDENNVYVDSALFHTGVVTKDVFLKVAPSAADQIDQAIETGGLIRVPRNELLVGVSQNADIRNDVMSHVKTSVFGDTQSELTNQQGDMDRELEAIANQSIVKAKDKDQAAFDFKEAADHIASQLDATGYGTKEGNKTRAILLASRASVIAYNNGMKPLEVVNKYMGKFRFDPKNETLPKHGNAAPSLTLDGVAEQWKSLGVDGSFNETDDAITLDNIVVPEESRNQGIGSQAMDALKAYADSVGKKLVVNGAPVEADGFFGKHGLVEEEGAGKNTDTQARGEDVVNNARVLVRPSRRVFNQTKQEKLEEIDFFESSGIYSQEEAAILRAGIDSSDRKSKVESRSLVEAVQDEQSTGSGNNQTPAHIRGESDLLARLVRAGDSIGIEQGRAPSLVGAKWTKAASYSDLSLRGGSFVRDGRSPEVIKTESDRLIASAKKNGFFIDKDAAADLFSRLSAHKLNAGIEHDAFHMEADDGGVVLRATAGGRYGPDDTKSPAQYLHRIEEYNQAFPDLQMRVIGVGQRIDGKAYILTVQKYVHGKEYKNMDQLHAALVAHGWEAMERDHEGKLTASRYKNKKTGAIISDVHEGNILYDAEGNLYPIDVIVEKLPAQQASGAAFFQSDKEGKARIAKRDAEYMAAVERGDMEAAQKLVNEAAAEAGYDPSTSERMSHAAPNSKDGLSVNLADVRGSDLVPEDFWTHPKRYASDNRELVAHRNVMDVMRRVERKRAGEDVDTALTVYRAIPKNAKDTKMRNGDWVSPLRSYAEDEGLGIQGGYKIIAETVDAAHLYFNGDSIAELGFDNGKGYAYRNTKNNRKLNDAVTRDENGNIVPLSKRFNSRKTEEFYQNDTSPRGFFDPSMRDITMLAKADLSTFLHETGHLFLEIQAELALDENASERMKSDMDSVLQWFGVKGENASERLAAWNAMPLEQKRPLHEKYAESFEQYLFEGKAPSAELEETFQTFRAWLSYVYTSIKNFLSESGHNADLNDEIRSVFDRMLATEEQIAQAQQTAGMMPMYASRPDGVSDAEWEAYQQAADDYVQAATEALSGRALRDLKWVRNAVGTKGKIMREMRREAAPLRREARMEARTRFLSQPIVQAYQFLTAPVEGVKARNKRARNSEHVDTARDSLFTAIAKLGGLNKEEAVSQYGLDPKDFLRKGGVFGKPVLRKEGGLSPDAMAEALSQFNYLPLDEHGKWDIRDLEDLLRDEAAGNPQYSADVDMDVLLGEPQRAFFDAENVEYMGGRLNRIDIRNMFDDIQLAEMAGIDPYTGEAVATEPQQEGDAGLQGYMQSEISEGDDDALRKEFTDTEKAYGGEAAYEKAKADGKTKLNYRQWVQVRTPRFKEWFGDWENDPKNASKVVAPETGEPMVVYHATDSDFSAFDRERLGANTKRNATDEAAVRLAKAGFWFHEKPVGDQMFSMVEMPVFLSIKNAYKPRNVLTTLWARAERGERVIPKLNDGIIAADNEFGGGNSFVAARSTQIKSAIGNNGAFDGSNPNILRQNKKQKNKDSNAPRTLESMGVLSDDGILPELVAGYFGMETEQLIRGLLGTPELGDIKQAIENMTDQIMLERHADLATPEAMAEATLKAVMNKARAKFVATEYAILAKAAGGARATEKQAKEYAQRVIGETKVKDIKPEKFIAAAAKAGKEAQKAMAKSDIKAALLAKRNQVLNEATAKLAVDVKDEVKKFDDLAARIIKATNEKNAKRGRDPDVVNAITAIMGFYGFFPSRQKNAMEYLERVREHDPDMFLRLQDAVNRAAVNQKDFNDLTINEMRGLREEIEGLWYTAKRSRQMEIDGKKIDLQEAADGLVTRLLEVGLPDEKLGAKNAPTEKDLLTHKLKTAGAWLTRVEQWAERMDGQWGGAFTRYIFQPVKKAADRYRTEATEYNRRYVALIDALPKMKRGLIAAPELGYTFGAGDQKVGMAELLHAVLHTGNASNKRKLLLGRGWAVLREDGSLDTARWDVFVERMHKQGVLKKEHYDFAQGVWDLLEDTKAGAQKTHRDVFGYYFAEVTADAFGTPFGIYRGGYVPAQADPRLVVDAAQRAMAEEENNTLVNAFPATAKGFTKGRTEYNRPLMLDLQSLSQHINKVLLFTHMEPAVRDVKKLLMRNDVAETLGAVDRAAYDSMLTPWLSVAARQSVNTPVTGDAGISNAVNIVRNNTGMALMAANLSNAMQQITGFLTATQKVKGKYLLRETASFLARPKEYANEVRAASEYMAVRMDAEIHAINSQLNELLIAPTAYQKTKAFAARHAYFLQAMMDNTMSPIIWRATFNQSVEKGMTDADAEQYANATIRQTQGSSLPEDVSRVEVGGAFWRATMQFYGYFNAMLNTNVVAVKNAKTKTEAMGHIIYGAILPAIVAQSIAVAMRGGVDDDDYDGWLDDWITEVAGTGLFRYATAMVPVVGAFVNLAVGYTTKTPVDDRMQTSATTSMISSALRSVDSVPDAITGNGKPSKAIKDVAAGISLFTGLPVFALARPVGYAADVAAGEVVPTSGADMVRGMLTGTASPGSK